MAHIVMAYIVMAYIVMAYIVMAYIVMSCGPGTRTKRAAQAAGIAIRDSTKVTKAERVLFFFKSRSTPTANAEGPVPI